MLEDGRSTASVSKTDRAGARAAAGNPPTATDPLAAGIARLSQADRDRILRRVANSAWTDAAKRKSGPQRR